MQAAAEREFPVFEVPYEVPFIAVTEAAFTQLVNEQYAVLRRALAAHERLERVVLSERGLEALAGHAGDADRRRRPGVRRARGAAGTAGLPPERWSPTRWRRCRPSCASAGGWGGPSCRRTRALADRSLALPVATEGAPGHGAESAGERVPQAWLVAIKDGGGPLSDFDRLTLHQAVTIVALELLRGRVAGDTERRLAGDVLAALVGGELDGRRAVAAAGAVRSVRAGGGDRRAAAGADEVESGSAAAGRGGAGPGPA